MAFDRDENFRQMCSVGESLVLAEQELDFEFLSFSVQECVFFGFANRSRAASSSACSPRSLRFNEGSALPKASSALCASPQREEISLISSRNSGRSRLMKRILATFFSSPIKS